jgi:anti-sigma factor RsiW
VNQPGEAELQAWVDRRLAAERQAEVETWLAAHPQERRRLEAYREQTERLRMALDAALDAAVPPGMTVGPRRRTRRWALALAAGLAGLVLGAGGGWFAGQQAAHRPGGFALQAAVAHAVFAAENRHAVEVESAEAEHLNAWLGKRLGGPLAAPDLSAVGYRLLGGRLLSTESGPAAQFMYEDGNGERLTLYLRADVTDEPEHAWRFEAEGDTTVYYWVMDGRGLAVVGRQDRAKLEAAGDIASAW